MMDHMNEWSGLNLSAKGSGGGGGSSSAAATIVSSLTAGGMNSSGSNNQSSGMMEQDDAPLNLSMKPSKSSNEGMRSDSTHSASSSSPAMSGASANSLQSLSTITAALGGAAGNANDSSRCKYLGRVVYVPSFRFNFRVGKAEGTLFCDQQCARKFKKKPVEDFGHTLCTCQK